MHEKTKKRIFAVTAVIIILLFVVGLLAPLLDTSAAGLNEALSNTDKSMYAASAVKNIL